MDAKVILKDDGQAVLEFILFLPFMIMMYFTILSIGNAINGSINQQKATRAYFYYRAANNSNLPRPRRAGDSAEPSNNWRTFGMQIMGWAEKFEDDSNPVAPCFKFNLPFEGGEDDSCDNPYTGTSTQFIRVQTVYGICGATYTTDGSNQKVRHPRGSFPPVVTSGEACLIVE